MKKAITITIALFLVLSAALVPGISSTGSAGIAQADTAEASVEASLTNLPLYFIENQGQLDQRVAYYLQGSDMNLYFTAQGVTFAMSTAGEEDGSQEQYAINLEFTGADPDVQPVGKDRTEAVISYFKGSPDEWKTGLPTYAGVIYPDLWPGIDLVYTGDNSHLKYTFLVQPGADPGQIGLAYHGASALTLNEGGQMEVSVPLGGFIDDRPVAYQDIGGKRLPVESIYALDEDTYSYGFELGTYDPGELLIIDPVVLIYCGYIGGSDPEEGRGIAVDGDGCAYVTGNTWSTETTFPDGDGFGTLTGPDTSYNGNNDAFVAKVKADGTGLVYCGYIGGSESDEGFGIAVASDGCAYVAGYTKSGNTSFPVAVGPDLSYNGGDTDAFVAKVNAGGTGLDYCGYIGGNESDEGHGIAVASDGCAYVAGYTESDEFTFPDGDGFGTVTGPDLCHNGVYDAFVAKVNAGGTVLDYCGYIGGSNHDRGWGIAVDGSGCAYVTGYTQSNQATFPETVGPDLTYNGDYDAFVAKVIANGSWLEYCGYIGGSDHDLGLSIAVDDSGCAYVAGYTYSNESTEGFPAVVGPDTVFNGGDEDAFVVKVKANPDDPTPENNFDYCGYIGGSGDDSGYGIAVDGSGCAYITGYTYSDETTFPDGDGFGTVTGPDLTYNGYNDAFVAKATADGSGLAYCGYIGGSADDYSNSIAVDGSGCAYITGFTWSDGTAEGFPVAVGPDTVFNGGDYDAFVAKICAYEQPVGGLVEHVDRLQILAPWLGLAAFMIAIITALFVVKRRRVA